MLDPRSTDTCCMFVRFALSMLLAACVLLASSTTASAAVWSNITRDEVRIAVEGAPMRVNATFRTVLAESGSQERVYMHLSSPDGLPVTWTGEQAGGPGNPCPGGSQPNEAVCWIDTNVDPGGGKSIVIEGSSGNDEITVSAPIELRITVHGGEGNDSIDATHTTFVPELDGGPGDDTLYSCACRGDWDGTATTITGGDGLDRVSFERAATGVPYSYYDDYGIGVDVERLTGSAHADVLHAPNADLVSAGAGDDYVSAPRRSGTIDLGAGRDEFVDSETSAFDHSVSGGSGIDTISLDGDKEDYFVCLDSRRGMCPASDGREGEQDRFGSDIERVKGSKGDDVLVGSMAANDLLGNMGNDVLIGGAGADTLRGGGGIDFVSYAVPVLQRLGVMLDRDGRRNDGNPRTDLVGSDVEGLMGSVANDRLVGSSKADLLVGERGNDVLVGKGGFDLLEGGPGNDIIDARDGRGGDVVKCGTGRDVVRADRGDSVAKDCERRS